MRSLRGAAMIAGREWHHRQGGERRGKIMPMFDLGKYIEKWEKYMEQWKKTLAYIEALKNALTEAEAAECMYHNRAVAAENKLKALKVNDATTRFHAMQFRAGSLYSVWENFCERCDNLKSDGVSVDQKRCNACNPMMTAPTKWREKNAND
jgi:hypothetical protein